MTTPDPRIRTRIGGDGELLVDLAPTPPDPLQAALEPWLRHKDWCNVKTDDPPDTERCKCGLAAVLAADTTPLDETAWLIERGQPGPLTRAEVRKAADNILDRPTADPDDDAAILARFAARYLDGPSPAPEYLCEVCGEVWQTPRALTEHRRWCVG